MESTKPRTASSLGMFDLLKGAGMLAIVFAHTAELYSLDAGGVSLTSFVFFIYRESLMAAFYIASGYGFRKRSIGKCIQQQCKTLLKPYLYTAAATTVLHFIIHYATFHYLQGALTESFKVLGGFVLGLPHTATYFGQEFFSCGPMWYLLALAVGWVLLDVIVTIFPKEYIRWAVAAAAVLGWGICLVWELPFCLAQGMVAVPYLYIGHMLKEKRAFERPVSRRGVLLLLAAALIVAAGACAARTTDCISMGEWTLGPLSVFLDGAVGYGILRLFIYWNRSQNALVRTAGTIGRRSLQIFCVHTVELTAIPWYLFAQRFAGQPLLGMLLQYALSMSSTLLLAELLVRRRELRAYLFPAPRRRSAFSAPHHYAARH